MSEKRPGVFETIKDKLGKIAAASKAAADKQEKVADTVAADTAETAGVDVSTPKVDPELTVALPVAETTPAASATKAAEPAVVTPQPDAASAAPEAITAPQASIDTELTQTPAASTDMGTGSEIQMSQENADRIAAEPVATPDLAADADAATSAELNDIAADLEAEIAAMKQDQAENPDDAELNSLGLVPEPEVRPESEAMRRLEDKMRALEALLADGAIESNGQLNINKIPLILEQGVRVFEKDDNGGMHTRTPEAIRADLQDQLDMLKEQKQQYELMIADLEALKPEPTDELSEALQAAIDELETNDFLPKGKAEYLRVKLEKTPGKFEKFLKKVGKNKWKIVGLLLALGMGGAVGMAIPLLPYWAGIGTRVGVSLASAPVAKWLMRRRESILQKTGGENLNLGQKIMTGAGDPKMIAKYLLAFTGGLIGGSLLQNYLGPRSFPGAESHGDTGNGQGGEQPDPKKFDYVGGESTDGPGAEPNTPPTGAEPGSHGPTFDHPGGESTDGPKPPSNQVARPEVPVTDGGAPELFKIDNVHGLWGELAGKVPHGGDLGPIDDPTLVNTIKNTALGMNEAAGYKVPWNGLSHSNQFALLNPGDAGTLPEGITGVLPGEKLTQMLARWISNPPTDLSEPAAQAFHQIRTGAGGINGAEFVRQNPGAFKAFMQALTTAAGKL